MISRRIIRVKVLQILYSFFKSDSDSIQRSEKELIFSVDKTFELYHYLLLLLIDIADYAQVKIEVAKNKNFPLPEEINPNTRFVDNPIILQLKESEDLIAYIQRHKLSWVNYPELIKNLYNEIKSSEVYSDYMNSEDISYKDHKDFIINFFGEFISKSELLCQILEEKSIYWNDDLEFVFNIVVKTISKFKVNRSTSKELIKMYKNDEDKDFIIDLYRKSILGFEANQKLIHEYTKNWELDRIAFMDILIMSQAITEAINFESIPVKVSLNEYIEIAKYYSTHKSNTFINGVLDKIFEHLKKENKIKKIGRGLIEN